MKKKTEKLIPDSTKDKLIEFEKKVNLINNPDMPGSDNSDVIFDEADLQIVEALHRFRKQHAIVRDLSKQVKKEQEKLTEYHNTLRELIDLAPDVEIKGFIT